MYRNWYITNYLHTHSSSYIGGAAAVDWPVRLSRGAQRGKAVQADAGLKSTPPGFSNFDCEKDNGAFNNLNPCFELAPLEVSDVGSVKHGVQ